MEFSAMSEEREMTIKRQTGADAISARSIAIGLEIGVVVTECVWDLGQDFGLQHAHRLDLCTETKKVRLYFADLELTAPDNNARKNRTEARLQSAIAQLSSRPPAPTYAYR
jgi:hypothetical protein